MSQNVPTFTWTGQRERAAVLLAEDELSDEKIADMCGVNRKTLQRWREAPAFAERIAAHVAALEAEAFKFSIAKRRKRVEALDDRWRRMKRVIVERAEAYEETPAGGGSGLLVKQLKGVGHGEDFTIVSEFAVDTGLLKELRAHEEQAAKELGQWTEKRDLTSGGEAVKAYIALDVDRV